GLLFRAVVDAVAGHARAGDAGRVAGAAALLALLVLVAALTGLEWPLARGLRRTGARIEEALRALYLRKIPRLPDRYFQTRPVSDMAERAHLLHRLRGLPALVGDVARLGLQIVVIGVGFGLGAALLVRAFARGAAATTDPGTILLTVYWALSLPAMGQELSSAVQQLPAQRNLTLRLLEPLGAPEDPAARDPAAARLDGAGGGRIQLSGVRVVV